MNRVGIILAGRYELKELLGSGGMADVYRAKDNKLNRNVAVKILRNEYSNDESFIQKFQQEAKAAACIQSPYVVNVYDVSEEDDINYIVMELAEGMTLKEYIQQKGKLEIVETIKIAMEIVSGICEAHKHGIIHRDIKPQNIMVDPIDSNVKVMDFGIAKMVTTQTITANTVGSVHYISPEQARGSSCDERCDIYSIGITMYEMITGRVPFDGDSTVAIALAHIKEPITPPSVYEPMIPVSFEKIIMKCTQKKVELRYENAEELLDDLKKALMTPDEDFVKEVVVPEVGETKVFTGDETKKIKSEFENTVGMKSQEEEDYQLGIEEDLEEDIEEDDKEEKDGKIEKVLLGIGIAAFIVVIIIAAMLFGKAFDIFKAPDNNETQLESTISQKESTSEDMVKMPSVNGLTREAAEIKLTDSGIKYQVKLKTSDNIEEGYVIEASEKSGDMILKTTEVELYVSSGKDTITIPDFIINKNEEAVKKSLEALGFEVVSEKKYSDNIQAGNVIESNPSVGQEVKRGSQIVIIVSAGLDPNMTKVPDVRNLTRSAALETLKAKDLDFSIKEEYSDSVESGKVISQSIESGTKVAINTVVNLTISLGKESHTVPYVIGKTKAEAEKSLKDAGVKYSISEEHSDDVESGKVISQSPDADSSIDSDTIVKIVISSGTEKSIVPDIIGISVQQAMSKLEKNGLTGHKIGEKESSIKEGCICEVAIPEGSSVDKGTSVGYYVSKAAETTADDNNIDNQDGNNKTEKDGDDSEGENQVNNDGED